MVYNIIKDSGRNISIVRKLWDNVILFYKLLKLFFMEENISRIDNSNILI